jgi:hypothetical protein
MTLACHNLSCVNGAEFRSEYKALKAIPNAGKNRCRALSNAMHRCYITGAARMLSRPSVSAGWSSPVARQAHNLKVAGSNPAPATKQKARSPKGLAGLFLWSPDLRRIQNCPAK